MKDAGSIVSLDMGVSLAEQTRGLDWAHWLLQSVRQRCEGIVIPRPTEKRTLMETWRVFVTKKFIPSLGPILIEAMQRMAARDTGSLVKLEREWGSALNKVEKERSILAGEILLHRTQGARYQGSLGHYREAVDAGDADGHVGIIWPCIAQLFQLSAASMLAEYLRLEWETAARDLDGLHPPIGSVSIARVVEQVLTKSLEEPRILKRAKAS